MPAQRPELSGEPPRRLGLGHRLLLALPRLGRGDKAPLGERIQSALLKPQEVSAGKTPGRRARLEAAEADARHMDDQERLIAFSLAPIAGLIAILLHAHQVANNPPARLSSGAPNPRHVSAGLALSLELVLLALAVVVLVAAWRSRRLFVGIALALYGVAVFNLHWWGFGIPFVVIGAYYIVRAYRLQQEVKGLQGKGGPGEGRPRANKRYTPPS